MDKYQALFAFYESRKDTPFEWGKSDCALLAADWIHTYRGVDYAASFRGRYRTELGSKRALSRQGFDSLEAVLSDCFGEPLSFPNMAQRGDVVLVYTQQGDAVGIVDGMGVMVQGEHGIVHVKHCDIKCAWRIS